MGYSRKLIMPLRQSIAVISFSSSFPKQFFYPKYDSFKSLIKGFEPLLRSHVSGFQCKSNTRRISFQSGHLSGSRIIVGSGILAVSAIFGSNGFRPNVSYAMDGLDILTQDDIDSWNASDLEENQNVVWKLVKKFWLPVFFFITVLSHLDDPLAIIVSKVILFLLSTKPSPLSVYVSVHELCVRSMRQESHMYIVKSLYAHKVEVQDYKLLCLASVEIRDQKFILVGILGGWWALPQVSLGTFSVRRLRALRQC